jgi:DNA replication protein DnaC
LRFTFDDAVKALGDLDSMDAPLRRTVLGIGWICTSCIHAAEIDRQGTAAKIDAQREARRIENLIRETDARGLYSGDTLIGHTFAHTHEIALQEHPQAFERAKAWAPTDKNLWVQGPRGTGKTWLCHCILAAHLVQGVSVAEVSGTVLNQMGREQWRDQAQPFCACEVLLIDDIDCPSWTPWGMEVIRHIVDVRHKRRATLVTANSTGAALAKAMCDSIHRMGSGSPAMPGTILSRLQPIEVIQMDGKDLRGRI